ncbi:MAG: cyanophycinase [Bacteroidota bacterium]
MRAILFVQSFLLLIISVCLVSSCSDEEILIEPEKPEIISVGPDSGNLLLLGGGILPIHAEVFLELAGGDSANIIVIPTALSDSELSRQPNFEKIKKRFSNLGIDSLQILHTRNREEANSNEFCSGLREATGVFFLGGNTQRILDAYKGTQVEAELRNLLARDGIIAGVSAGSGAQGSLFFDHRLQRGFQFLEGTIIMNHFLSRNKQFDHSDEISRHDDYLSIGIDDNTGVLVQSNLLEVIGNSYVAIYDGTNYYRSNDSISKLPPGSEAFYLLQNGDRYDLLARKVDSPSRRVVLDLDQEELALYAGNYEAMDRDFAIQFYLKGDTLMVRNSWGWDDYPIIPYEKDVFFALNRNMWFEFEREDGLPLRVHKRKSMIQPKKIVTLVKSQRE